MHLVPVLSHRQLKIVCALSYHARNDDVCFPSIATLASLTALTERHCRETLRELELAGLIVRIKGDYSAYRLLLNDPKRVTHDDPKRVIRGPKTGHPMTQNGSRYKVREKNNEKNNEEMADSCESAQDPNLGKPTIDDEPEKKNKILMEASEPFSDKTPHHKVLEKTVAISNIRKVTSSDDEENRKAKVVELRGDKTFMAVRRLAMHLSQWTKLPAKVSGKDGARWRSLLDVYGEETCVRIIDEAIQNKYKMLRGEYADTNITSSSIEFYATYHFKPDSSPSLEVPIEKIDEIIAKAGNDQNRLTVLAEMSGLPLDAVEKRRRELLDTPRVLRALQEG